MVGEVVRQIESRNHFVLTSHARPDGDAVGSLLACWLLLRAMGKEAEPVLKDPVPVIYRPLPHADRIIQTSRINGRYDAAIVLECDSVQRTRLEGLENRFLINIDHHLSGRPFANVNWIDPAASSTAELIYRLALAAEVPITPEMATCLYTAVLTDTGSFCYPGTNAHTFELAQELVKRGADPVHIARDVYFANPTSKMRLLGAALRTLQREGPLAWMHCTHQDMEATGALEEDAEGLVNYALAIAGVEVAAFFRQTAGGRFRVSLRSKGGLNVAAVAEMFGGGGHHCASGFPIDGPLPAAVDRILTVLRSRLPR
jgi:bifunctional oligoribonuclease and PAP phosphatase NrnA